MTWVRFAMVSVKANVREPVPPPKNVPDNVKESVSVFVALTISMETTVLTSVLVIVSAPATLFLLVKVFAMEAVSEPVVDKTATALV